MSTHVLFHGDCVEQLRQLENDSVDMVLTDIPYGEISQKSAGLRRLDRGVADRCEINLETLVNELIRVTKGSFYVFCGTQQISELITLFKNHGFTTRLGAWEKTNPSPMNGEKLWLSGLEFCVFVRKPKATFNERCKKALWQSPSGKAKIHPTQKPIQLMERLIKASSLEGGTVLDCCMGSGSTGVAALNTGRKFVGIELDKTFFDISSQRLLETEKEIFRKIV